MPDRTIFIVDDDPSMIAIMSAWLEASGHQVASDTIASTAIPQIETLRPDAILVDLMMAEVDGLELLNELRGRPTCANAAILMITTRTDELWRQKALDAGADGFLGKPLDQIEFVERVEEVIAEKLKN